MLLIDIIFISIIAVFALLGFFLGLVRTVVSLLGIILGIYLASRYYEPIADWLIAVTGWGDNIARVSVFIIAFLLINQVVGLFFWLFTRVTGIITRLPLISGINRLLGLLFGIIKGVVIVGMSLYVIARFPLSDRIMDHIEDSVVAPYAVDVAEMLLPLIPEALQMLQNTVDSLEEQIT